MKIALYFVLLAIVFTSGKRISCYHCIEGNKPAHGSNLFSDYLERQYSNYKSPSEECEMLSGGVVGPTCTAITTCFKATIKLDNRYPVIARYCSPIPMSDEVLPEANMNIENAIFTITTSACNGNLCNGASSATTSFTNIIFLITLLFA